MKRIKCDQCDSVYINRIFCHEHGCINRNKKYDKETDRWIRFYKCRECGQEIEEGEACSCMEDVGVNYG